MLEIILIVVLVLLLLGGIPAWGARESYGYGPSGLVGLLVVIVLVILLVRYL
jgi:hypothetical protein